MKQNLPNIIRENKELQQTLLEQEGGFMKYLVEHLDSDGFTLYRRYQDYVLNEYLNANTWNPDVQLLPEEELRTKALGPDSHLTKELRLRWDLEQLLADVLDEETAETVKNFYDGYMAYAWREFFELRNPEHATDLGLYKTLMEQYSWPDGLACRCMELTLKEHHNTGWTENDKYDYYRIAEYYYFYFGDSTRQGKRAFDRLRRGVKEWLEGKSDEESRELAVDMLKKVKWFSQRVYNDEAVCSLNGVRFPLEDKQWLRDMARSLGEKPGIMGSYFSEFVFLLQEVGRIWAARLLKEHRIDLHTLEKEAYSFIQPYKARNDGYDYRYYVDHYYTNDSPNTCCVNSDSKAKELLYLCYGRKIEAEYEECYEKATHKDSPSGGPSKNEFKDDRIKPKPGLPQTVPPPPKNLTLKYFRNDETILKEQERRVAYLYNKWQFKKTDEDPSWGWLPSEISLEQFRELFTGKVVACKLKFAKNDAILMIFFKWLIKYKTKTDSHKKEFLIEPQTSLSATRLLSEQFGITSSPVVSRVYNKDNKDNEDIKRIKESIYILDYNCVIPTKPGGRENEVDLRDDIIQQCSNNIDLGLDENVDVEDAIKSGVLRSGKHT